MEYGCTAESALPNILCLLTVMNVKSQNIEHQILSLYLRQTEKSEYTCLSFYYFFRVRSKMGSVVSVSVDEGAVKKFQELQEKLQENLIRSQQSEELEKMTKKFRSSIYRTIVASQSVTTNRCLSDKFNSQLAQARTFDRTRNELQESCVSTREMYFALHKKMEEYNRGEEEFTDLHENYNPIGSLCRDIFPPE